MSLATLDAIQQAKPELYKQLESGKRWREEVAHFIAEAHKIGWQKMIEKTKKRQTKYKTKITRRKRQIEKFSMLDSLSGKRRKFEREIKEAETKLNDEIERLDQATKVREVFDR